MAYTPQELQVLLTPETIENAFEAGVIEDRVNGDDVEICFPADDDPGCQIRYIWSGCDEEEWNALDDYQRCEAIAAMMIEMVAYEDTYPETISEYADVILAANE